jgi:hypothetical protein
VDEIVAIGRGLLEREAIVMGADQEQVRIADPQAAEHVVADTGAGGEDEDS